MYNGSGTGPCGSTCTKWPNNSSAGYFLTSAITNHSAWPGFISYDASQLNGVPAALNPTLSRSYSPTAPVTVNVESLGGDLCGLTTLYHSYSDLHVSTGAYVRLNTDITYGGRNGYHGDCPFDGTVMHEFGHAEALGHSACGSCVMAPVAGPEWMHLQPDDKLGLQTIY